MQIVLLIRKAFETSIIKDGIKIASPSGLVALKFGRFSRKDQADIEDLVNSEEIDLSIFNLSQDLLDRFKEF